MSSPRQRPGLAMLSLAANVGMLGWLVLFIIFWLFVSGVVIFAVAGAKGLIEISAGLLMLFVFLPLTLATRKRKVWVCGGCRQPFQPGLTRCPHCGVAVVPPGTASGV